MTEKETRTEIALREGTEASQASRQILDYAWQMKKQNLADSTIKLRVYRLKHLAKVGANLMNPDSVLTVLATNNWTESNKRIFILAYQSFATTYNLQWKKPKTRVEQDSIHSIRGTYRQTDRRLRKENGHILADLERHGSKDGRGSQDKVERN